MTTVSELVKKLNLLKHPEGGFYKEVYRSEEKISSDALPDRFGGERNFSTSIYYLLEKGDFSAFHRIKSDETWHFYSGDPLEIFIIDNTGKPDKIILGSPEYEGVFQYTVLAGNWFAARTVKGGSWSLVGCTVAPGFDFNDFELAERRKLIDSYPGLKDIIQEFTR